MKKFLIAFIITILSVAFFIYRDEFMMLVMYIEDESETMPLMVGMTLILIKTLTAPLGFPGAPLTLLSGSLLGNSVGTLVALVGNTLGASLAFLLSRYVLQDYVRDMLMSRYPKIQEWDRKIEEKALSTIIILRLIPLFPFNALNFILGVTSVPFRKYALGSFIGMIPGTFLFVYFGESLRMLSFMNIAFSLFGIAALSYIGKAYAKKI